MLDLAILGAYLLAVLFVGFRAAAARRRGLEDYVLAGRRLTLPMFVASLVPAFYGGVLGIGEFAWTNGLVNWLAMGVPYYLFAGAYALFLSGRVRARPGRTLPDHLEGAYGRRVALLGAFLVFVIASPADEVLMLGTLLGWATGLPLAWAMALGGLAALAYALKGGLRAGVWTGHLELLFMFGGFALILPFAWVELGPPSSLPARLPPGHLDPLGGFSAAALGAWFLIGLWTVVDPAFHQRCAAAADAGVARRGILVSIGFWAAFDAMTTLAGLYARAALPDLQEPLRAFPLLADRLLPPVAKGLFLAGLCSSLLAALQATSFLSALALAKDGAGRLLSLSEAEQERWTGGALALSWAAAFALALWRPSVAGLWYAVGSAVIPGLLLPMLGAYWTGLRVGPRTAFAASLAGWLASTAWVALGTARGYPLGLEPMAPGLLLSAAIWSAGLVAARMAP